MGMAFMKDAVGLGDLAFDNDVFVKETWLRLILVLKMLSCWRSIVCSPPPAPPPTPPPTQPPTPPENSNDQNCQCEPDPAREFSSQMNKTPLSELSPDQPPPGFKPRDVKSSRTSHVTTNQISIGIILITIFILDYAMTAWRRLMD